MLKEEMKRLFAFIHGQIRVIDEHLAIVPSDFLSNGVKACLKKKRLLYKNQIFHLTRLWEGIVDTPSMVEVETDHRHVAEIHSNDSIEDKENTQEPTSDFMIDEDKEDEPFILELSSDSDLSDNE